MGRSWHTTGSNDISQTCMFCWFFSPFNISNIDTYLKIDVLRKHGSEFNQQHFSLFPAVPCLVARSCPTLCDPMDWSPPGSSVHGDSPGKNTEWVPMPSSRGLPKPVIKPRSPVLQADSLLSEPPGKPPKTELKWYPIPSPGDLPAGVKSGSPALQMDSLPAELPGSPVFCFFVFFLSDTEILLS